MVARTWLSVGHSPDGQPIPLSRCLTIDDYDDVERDDILAVLAFAAKMSRVKSIDAHAP